MQELHRVGVRPGVAGEIIADIVDRNAQRSVSTDGNRRLSGSFLFHIHATMLVSVDMGGNLGMFISESALCARDVPADGVEVDGHIPGFAR